jgi:hypothetical protein
VGSSGRTWSTLCASWNASAGGMLCRWTRRCCDRRFSDRARVRGLLAEVTL